MKAPASAGAFSCGELAPYYRQQGASAPELTTGTLFRPHPRSGLDPRTKTELCSVYVLQEVFMLKVFVEEAAALASIVLFVGMIAVWAQLITQL
jgi:hypothetical protein